MITVKIFNESGNSLPEYKTPLSAGVDLRAFIPKSIVLHPMQRVLIPTGLHIEMEAGMEAQVRSRSGLAHKYGVVVLNSPGTVDADYRGDIGVPLINFGEEDFVVNPGDRIAQLVFARHESAEFLSVESLEELTVTDRGSGGFGHTGVK